MSDTDNYPIRSTARVFRDVDGNECTLIQLIRREPLWAQRRIYDLEEINSTLRQQVEWIEDYLRERTAFCDLNNLRTEAATLRTILNKMSTLQRTNHRGQ